MELEIKKKEDGSFSIDTAKLEESIKTGQIEAIKGQIQSALQVEKQNIFPDGDDRFFKRGESLIDTSFFYDKKGFSTPRGQLSGSQMGARLRASGGPFVTLSPAMEKFADCCRAGFDPNKMLGRGINIGDYNKEILEWNKKDTMSGLTTTDAGALVPIEFLATVIEFAIGQSQILPRLWRIPMGGHTLRIPQLTQSAGSYFGGIILYHPDELASKTLTEPAFTYKEFTAKELIGLIALSDSLIQDSSINIINYITGVFVRAFQWQQEKEVISGTGLNNQMTGILSDSSINSVARKTHGTVTYDDMINLESALDENFQDLTYLTRRATFNAVRLQKATTNQPVWTYLYPLPGQGSQFNEYPVFKTRNLPAMGTTGDVILGDLGFYIWTVRQDMAIDLSRDRYFEYNATAVRFVMRVDGKPGVSIAFAVLKSTPQS